MRGLVFVAAMGLGVATASAEDPYDVMRDSCASMLKGSQSQCECIVKSAKDKLNPKELAMVVAGVKGDRAGITKAQGQLSQTEMLNAMQFMSQTPGACGIN